MIANTIKILQSDDFYGAGECVELAKGKNELVGSFKDFKTKCKRVWRNKRR